MKLFPKALNNFEVRQLSNGCGPSGWLPKWIKKLIPEFTFKEACNMHDCYYWRGGTEKDKKNVDTYFLKQMRYSIKKVKWYRKPLLHLACSIYYLSVSKFGNKSFYFGEQRTYEDLQQYLEEERCASLYYLDLCREEYIRTIRINNF